MNSYSSIFETKKNILFVVAHPDDVVVFYGALISKLVSDHKNIFVVTVSNGARGSRDDSVSETELAKIRINEDLSALKFLGVPESNYTNLNYLDGEINSDYKLIGEISYHVRKSKADIVCTHEPTFIYGPTYDKSGFFVQHRDHRKTAEAVMDSAYPFSRDRSFFPEHFKEGIEPHTVTELLLTDEIQSNFELVYTDAVDTKKQALLCYKSQLDVGGATEIVDAVKSDNHYLEKYFYVNLLW
ncbi:PIG-L family deacetylase [Candidatus Shapirobacteria bacterium]|nr:PIG-L family deacetylase [Candidatus Shapirobacteria bacterium]